MEERKEAGKNVITDFYQFDFSPDTAKIITLWRMMENFVENLSHNTALRIVAPSAIEPATFQLVAQSLCQLHFSVPHRQCTLFKYRLSIE